ncbi:hypothetical protein LSH36_218g01009 [Paralvinella palmiformis]|uniref:Sushi domain-containing protein n=1 Tax=Paralvinella palmiformis TaxID=53620 RepID=A0AAD9JNY4_9ANNE|nr:hypothetical protein LSH36_218g01009 [Paralvinella palmiformis]
MLDITKQNVLDKVLQLPREACKHDGRHIQSQRVGFLSPLSSKHVRHEKRCPLVIKAEPGQRISFTLYDFAFRNETGPRFSTEQYCQQYFVIREPFVGSDVTICSGDERERPQVYISRTHEVAVELSAKSDQPTFIIKYEVIGCPRLKTPEGTVVTYNDDVIKVSCNNSRESFTLKCVNNTWFGELRNCSIPGSIPF